MLPAHLGNMALYYRLASLPSASRLPMQGLKQLCLLHWLM